MIRRPFCRSTFPAFLLLLLALALCGEAAELPAGFTPPSVTQLDPQVEARVNGLLAQLTTEEKISLLSGTTYMTTQAIKRLGIPQLKFSDGPVGVRCWGQSTAYPADILLAATWDRDAAKDMGAAIGRDARARGVHVVLAPGTNIYREAQNGRNFEYVGEDPFLASAVVVNYIRGMQSQDVAACIKHFVANEEETRRNSMNVIVGRRALEEIYFPPFKAAINEGNVWTAMAAYNKVNGDWCTENKFLLTDTLRDQWHFQGLLMSDWGAVHNTLRDLNSGTDLEMDGGKPRKFYNAEAIKPLLASHAVSPQTLDEHVRRLLRLIVSMGFMDRDQTDSSIPLDDPQSAAVALKVASEGIVLLKNENKLLPLARAQTHRVVVLGPNAQRAVIGAGGSSGVNPFSSISALQAIQTVAGPGVQVDYISESIDALYPHSVFIPVAASGGKPGLSAEYFSNAQLEGTPVVRRVDPAIDFKTGNESPLPAIPQDSAFSIRWRGAIQPSETGDFIFAGTGSGGWRILLDGKVVTDKWTLHNHGSSEDVVPLKKNQVYQLAVEYSHPEGSAEMHFGWGRPQFSPAEQAQIKSADAVIYAGGLNPETEHESMDRDWALHPWQDEQIAQVAALNPHVVLSINAGGNLGIESLDHVPALLWSWYPGQNGNLALAKIIFGDINPSGHLPDSFEKRFEDSPAFGNFPGDVSGGGTVRLDEGIYVGYRWFDKKAISPAFPFGFGLSYSTFELAKMQVALNGQGDGRSVTVSAQITNTSSCDGAAVVQLYVRPVNSAIDRPVQELKGFARVMLKAGESQTVTLQLDRQSFATYDERTFSWIVPAGEYQLALGTSSRDIAQTSAITW